jgi:hypothetical protein
MMGEVVSIRKSTNDDINETIDDFNKIISEHEIVSIAAVVLTNTGDTYRIYTDTVHDRIKILGALEILKHDLLPDPREED